MRRRTFTCIGLALALVLATGGFALAAIYRGGSTEDPKVRVGFEKDHGTIKRFKIERARFFCTDGDRFRAGTRVGRMEIRREGRFRGRFTDSNGGVSVRVRGRVNGRRARGSFRMVTLFGTVECNTYRVKWNARRKPAG